MAYPPSDVTFGETETYVTCPTEIEDDHYEEAQIFEPTDSSNDIGINGTTQDNCPFDFKVTLRNPDSSLPKNRAEFILNLDQTEVDRVLAPIRNEILSVDTVFSLRDTRCGISLAISGQEILEILENTGRTMNMESIYENENVDYNLDKKSWRRRIAIFCLITTLILIVIAVTVTLIILKPWETDTKPPVFPITSGSVPVIVVFGGGTYKVKAVGMGTTDLFVLDTIEVYYPDNSKKNKLLAISMLTPRYGHATGRLGDNVIIAGGDSGQAILDSVEIFNLINGSITFGPSLVHKRYRAAGITYGNRFFVCGGYKHSEKHGPLDLNELNKNLSWTPAKGFLDSSLEPKDSIYYFASTTLCNTSVLIACILHGNLTMYFNHGNKYYQNRCMLRTKNKDWVKINPVNEANLEGYTLFHVETMSHGCAIYAMGGSSSGRKRL